jgi:hypothetical protein
LIFPANQRGSALSSASRGPKVSRSIILLSFGGSVFSLRLVGTGALRETPIGMCDLRRWMFVPVIVKGVEMLSRGSDVANRSIVDDPLNDV